MSGYPQDEDKFRSFMYDMSCNPIAVERILTELREAGFKLTTVRPTLDFVLIGGELDLMGVKMEIVYPVAPDKVNKGELDHAALCLKLGQSLGEHLTPEELVLVQQRAAATPDLKREKLGPYSSI
jgi:hypothetical protein